MRRLTRLPPSLHAALVSALLAGSWALVYAAGGTRTAVPHVFYIPIVLAALPFGVWGGLCAGVVAMLLAGPAMPLDVATHESQQIVNWLIRGAFFITVGAVAGSLTVAQRRSFQAGLVDQLQAEIELATPLADLQVEPGWQARVHQALQSGGPRIVFQPIYALDDGRLVAVEALARFDTVPNYPPEVWFEQAANLGFGVELELAAIEAALETSSDLPAGVALTFNASPATLTDERLLHLLDTQRDRPMIAEITEHALIEDYHELDVALAALRSRGVQLAVDDAGAGFASLRHIVRLQPELIKLDPSLTQDLGSDPVRRPLAECLVQFALKTDSKIIVEGIETAADLTTWQHLGAHAAQGYLLGRPGTLPAAVRSANAHPRLTASSVDVRGAPSTADR
ncbi:EAL domain-containing protein [Nitriliruptor alkaliphilus]|uniref:EAL domain-containing protein n=1 Tax=Nitriliruptor alkaliphilus TaxID=427918 RepID=UPI00069622EC|nr:EAL domain-containing protein [Nitriliruptor alkaliphilus]